MNSPSSTRTKLVATIGPACETAETLWPLLDAGIDVCRLNFSHGELSKHGEVLALIRGWSDRSGRTVSVLGDLCGPKIRLNTVEGGSFALATGATIRVSRGTAPCTPSNLTSNYTTLLDEIDVGHRLYIDDGQVRLIVTERDDDAVCQVTVGGRISSRKGINLPDTRLTVPAVTEKDRRDARWAAQHGLDYVALSFVRNPDDVRTLRAVLAEAGGGPAIISKIEKVEALEHMDELIGLSDGIMVARGDLGVEMDAWQVPLIQKSLTARCRAVGRPVIVATQMLQSMIQSPTPTRAEVSDVANAIFDGSDAVMLSAESAAGEFPLAAIEMMKLIANAADAYQAQSRGLEPVETVSVGDRRTAAIARAAVQAALHLDVRLVAVWTATGESARLLAQHRLPMTVVGVTSEPSVARRINLYYGVRPMLVPPFANPGELANQLDRRLLEAGLAKPGDLIVVVTSTQPLRPGETDTTLIHRVNAS